MRVTLISQGLSVLDKRNVRKVESMRKTQAVALDLWEKRGFSAVTIEEIADAAGTSPATIYRNFVTKENLVLWDEYDPIFLDEIRARLGKQPVVRAVRDGLIAALDRVYTEDSQRILRRAKLIYQEKLLRDAMMVSQLSTRQALETVLSEARVATSLVKLQVIAGALLVALEVAVQQWVHHNAEKPLRYYLRQAFEGFALFQTTDQLQDSD